MSLLLNTPRFDGDSVTAAHRSARYLWADFVDIWINFAWLVSFWDMSRYLVDGGFGQTRKFPKLQFASSQVFFHPNGHDHTGGSSGANFHTDANHPVHPRNVDKNSVLFLWSSLTSEKVGSFSGVDTHSLYLLHMHIPIPAADQFPVPGTTPAGLDLRYVDMLDCKGNLVITDTTGKGVIDLPAHARCIAITGNLWFRRGTSHPFNGTDHDTFPYMVYFHNEVADESDKLKAPRAQLAIASDSTTEHRVLHLMSVWAV